MKDKLHLITLIIMATIETGLSQPTNQSASLGTNELANQSCDKGEIREHGVFGFPQAQAKVVCDTMELRVSLWNNEKFLVVQAVLWLDDDSSLGKTEDNQAIGDYSLLNLDLDADGTHTPNVDRIYALNPWPSLAGLNYQVCLTNESTTVFQKGSEGHGAIRYLNLTASDKKRVRIDTYLIPMAEISRRVGDKIRICFEAFSPKPAFYRNSVGHASSDIPLTDYHEYTLSQGGKFDATLIPDERADISKPNLNNM